MPAESFDPLTPALRTDQLSRSKTLGTFHPSDATAGYAEPRLELSLPAARRAHFIAGDVTVAA
jgi:hypothetical protein